MVPGGFEDISVLFVVWVKHQHHPTWVGLGTERGHEAAQTSPGNPKGAGWTPSLGWWRGEGPKQAQRRPHSPGQGIWRGFLPVIALIPTRAGCYRALGLFRAFPSQGCSWLMRGAKPGFSDALLETPPLSWCPAGPWSCPSAEERAGKPPGSPSLACRPHPFLCRSIPSSTRARPPFRTEGDKKPPPFPT